MLSKVIDHILNRTYMSGVEREKFHFQIQFLEERLAHSDEQLVKAMDMLRNLIGKMK